MIRSPSEHTTLAFLTYLRENNYLSKSYKEYDKGEVDEMYMEKCTRLGAKLADQAYRNRWREGLEKWRHKRARRKPRTNNNSKNTV